MKHLLNFDPATNFFDRYAVAKGLAKLILQTGLVAVSVLVSSRHC
jgi:hypothetical protein